MHAKETLVDREVKDGDKVEIGTPYIEGVEVVGKVEKEGRAKKIIVFKYKKRKL